MKRKQIDKINIIDPVSYEWQMILSVLQCAHGQSTSNVTFSHSLFPANESKLRDLGYEVVQTIGGKRPKRISEMKDLNIWGPDNLIEKHVSIIKTHVTRSRPALTLLTLVQRAQKFGRVTLDHLITLDEEKQVLDAHLNLVIRVTDASSTKFFEFTSLMELFKWDPEWDSPTITTIINIAEDNEDNEDDENDEDDESNHSLDDELRECIRNCSDLSDVDFE